MTIWEYPATKGTSDGRSMREYLQERRGVEFGSKAGLLMASILGLSTVFEGASPALPLWDSAASVVSEWGLT